MKTKHTVLKELWKLVSSICWSGINSSSPINIPLSFIISSTVFKFLPNGISLKFNGLSDFFDIELLSLFTELHFKEELFDLPFNDPFKELEFELTFFFSVRRHRFVVDWLSDPVEAFVELSLEIFIVIGTSWFGRRDILMLSYEKLMAKIMRLLKKNFK